VICRVISTNLKLRGMDKCLEGVNMREVQIYIENIEKHGGGGGVASELGVFTPP